MDEIARLGKRLRQRNRNGTIDALLQNSTRLLQVQMIKAAQNKLLGDATCSIWRKRKYKKMEPHSDHHLFHRLSIDVSLRNVIFVLTV